MGNALRRMALAARVLFIIVAVALPAGPAAAGKKGGKAAAVTDGKSPPRGFNAKTAERHLRDHQRYPASKEQILAECDNLSELTPNDRKWFTDKLPDGNYQSPDAVLEAVGLKLPPKR